MNHSQILQADYKAKIAAIASDVAEAAKEAVVEAVEEKKDEAIDLLTNAAEATSSLLEQYSKEE